MPERSLVMLMEKSKLHFDKFTAFAVAILVPAFSFWTMLFWRMSSLYLGPRGYYHADFSDHINFFTHNDRPEYSLILLISEFLHTNIGAGVTGVAVFAAMLVATTVVVGYKLMRKIHPNGNRYALFLFSFFSLFTIPIYIPFINSMMYSQAFCGGLWHNITYFGMRMLAMLVLIFLYDRIDNYLTHFSIKEYLIFAILLTLVNWAKPNFIIAFGPALLVIMIIDIIKSRGVGFKKWVCFGVMVLISLIPLIYQYATLFNTHDPSDPDGGITFSLGETYHNLYEHPFIMFFQASAFPLVVLIYNYKRKIKGSKFFFLCALMMLFAFAESYFLRETGTRANDGNFSWGSCFCYYLVFCVSSAFFIGNAGDYLKEKKKTETTGSSLPPPYILVSSFLFLLHLACGIEYFILISLGASAYMF